MDPASVLIWITVYMSALGALSWAVIRRKLPPVEKNAPIERSERALYTVADRVLDAVSRQYDLVVDVDVAKGRVNGNLVRIEVTPFGTAGDDIVKFACSVQFEESLRLELSVTPHKKAPAQAIVSPEFDEIYEVDALHPDQAKALFSGALEKKFLAAHRNGWHATLSDEMLLVSIPGRLGDDSVRRGIDWMIEIAAKLPSLRERVGRSALESAWESAWKHVADTHAAKLEVRTRGVRLELELGRIGARLDRAGEHGFSASIAFELAHPLPFEIALSPEVERSFVERWKHPDIQLGDEKFDEAFVVKGDPEEAIKGALGPAARGALLELFEKSKRISLDSTRIELALEPAVTNETELEQLISTLIRALTALAPRTEKSAYR